MALFKIATALAGLLMSKGGRRFAGRHAGKSALATLEWNLYQQHRGRNDGSAGAGQPARWSDWKP